MLVQEIMHTTIPTVRADESIRSVAAIICTQSIEGMPVVDENNALVGIVSAQQILGKLLPSYADFIDDEEQGAGFRNMVASYTALLERTVGEVMSQAYTVFPEDSASLAASLMSVHGVRYLPVINRVTNELEGVVTLEEIHKAMFIRGMGLAA